MKELEEVFVMFERMIRSFLEIVNRLLAALGKEPIDDPTNDDDDGQIVIES